MDKINWLWVIIIMLILLKAFGKIEISWLWCFAPLWISAAIGVGVWVICIIILFIHNMFK